jgi:vacuolar-type H+-ATPase subunit C/Vma6
MGKTSTLNYAFAVGKIRALEKFLISSEVFEEALDVPLPEALRLFAESDLYSDELLHVKNSRQLEEILAQEKNSLRRMVGELVLDKELVRLLGLDTVQCAGRLLKSHRSIFLETFLRHLIDMHNIKTFLRLYILKEPQEKLKSHLLCEGFIKKEDLFQWYNQELAVFLNKLEYVHRNDGQIIDYTFYLGEAVRFLESSNSFIPLESRMQSFLITTLLLAKYITFGPEPLLAYYFARMNEINLIRLIILAKINAFPKELVKERLNSVYA